MKLIATDTGPPTWTVNMKSQHEDFLAGLQHYPNWQTFLDEDYQVRQIAELSNLKRVYGSVEHLKLDVLEMQLGIS